MSTTNVQRPLEWMRFDPVKFALLVDGESLEVEGAFIRIIRHLWNRGPLPEAEVRRICKGSFDTVRAQMTGGDEGLSITMVEEARAHGQRRVDQRVEAGQASAAKRKEQSTSVERPLNDRPTDVLSKSISISKSTSSEKERASIAWPQWAGPNTQKAWEDFKAYRTTEHRLRYKSAVTEQKAVDILLKYWNNGPELVAALEHATGKNWRFPVDPAEYKYPKVEGMKTVWNPRAAV